MKYDERGGAVLDGPKALNFMNFPVAGSAVTFDSCSFAPDSASTATSIATGHKTYSGMINVDETGATSFETIADKLHSQKGWKIGIISSVNINHATPAAFYAHQASRNSYYEIGLEMIDSGFEYFAGGALKKVNGAEGDKEKAISESSYVRLRCPCAARYSAYCFRFWPQRPWARPLWRRIFLPL